MKEVKFRIPEDELEKVLKIKGHHTWKELALLGAEVIKKQKKR